MYDIASNKWSTLPDANKFLAVHEIIGGRLTLVGGEDCDTNKVSKSLSSYDEDSQSWIKYFPDMLTPRNRCSVVNYGDSVIVAGGDAEDEYHSTIEVMNIIEMRWREVATHLPCPMWNMSTTICSNEMYIIGYKGDDNMHHMSAYKLSANQIVNSTTARSWSRLNSPLHARTTVVPYFIQPLIVGGCDTEFNGVANVSMSVMGSWTHVDTLKTPRAYPIVAAVDDNAIIVIGGCLDATTVIKRWETTIATVEIGQAVPIHDHLMLPNEEDAEFLGNDNHDQSPSISPDTSSGSSSSDTDTDSASVVVDMLY